MSWTVRHVSRTGRGVAACVAAGLIAAACASAPTIPAPSELPLSKDAMMLLGRKDMKIDAPIYIRIFKEESELEVWKQRDDGRFYHFKSYPICNWSGELGPKVKQGDKQAPEGFYTITAEQLNPKSSYHLAFNLGFPNAYDRSLARTGDFVMIHGQCRSAGCYAMTDALIEEIYALGRDALQGGQKSFQVHAFPFRMTDSNLARHVKNPWYPFWMTMKQGYDHFETTRVPPEVAVCERRYVVNVKLPQSRLDPERQCPQFERPAFDPFIPKPTEQQIASERIVSPGQKTRDIAGIGSGATSFGLGFGPPSARGTGAGSSVETLTGLGFQQR